MDLSAFKVYYRAAINLSVPAQIYYLTNRMTPRTTSIMTIIIITYTHREGCKDTWKVQRTHKHTAAETVASSSLWVK